MGTLNPNKTLLQGAHQSSSDLTPAPLSPRSSDVSFAFQGVQPPSMLYIDVDDQLVLSCATNQANEIVTVNVRLLLPNGRLEDMQFVARPGATRVVVATKFSLAQGFILSMSASGAVSFTRGQTFVRIAIQRSAGGTGQPAQMLFADYVTALATSAYPNGRILSPTEGPGWLNVIVVNNPAAGADWGIALPTNARWRIQSWFAVFTTSAAVANRLIAAQLNSGNGVMWIASALINAVASLGYNVSAAAIAPYIGLSPTTITLPLPPNLVLATMPTMSESLQVVTGSIQAADQWSAIHINVEEWLESV